MKTAKTTVTLPEGSTVSSEVKPKLYRVVGEEYEHFNNLSLEEDNELFFDFGKTEFMDGVNSKTFVFAINVDGTWYYSNEFTVTYSEGGIPVPTEYDITVTGGTASANKATAGTEITLTVDESAIPAGKVFDEWEVASGGVTIADGKFTMPESNVVIKAAYKDASVQPDEGEEDGNEPSGGNEGDEPKKPEPNDGGKEDVIAKTGDDVPFAGLFATVAAAGIAVLALRRRIA